MYETELETAVAAARAAGTAVLQRYAGSIVVESKIGADKHPEPVTAADREASSIIVENLRERFPDDGILSEEEHDDVESRLGRERVWIIDPIDGTAGFIKKDGDFAVQIGLAAKGSPVVGAVLLPFHNVIYYAAAGLGAYSERGGEKRERIHVSEKTNFAEIDLAVSRNHRSPKISRIKEQLGFRREIERGSVGLKIGLIAERSCDVYIHLGSRTKTWDTCAPQIILEEAGGRLTDLWGGEFRYNTRDVQNRGGIVASNGVVHDETIARIQPLLNEFGRLKVAGRGN